MAQTSAGGDHCLQTDFLGLGGAVGDLGVPSALPWWDTTPSSLQPCDWLLMQGGNLSLTAQMG